MEEKKKITSMSQIDMEGDKLFTLEELEFLLLPERYVEEMDSICWVILEE